MFNFTIQRSLWSIYLEKGLFLQITIQIITKLLLLKILGYCICTMCYYTNASCFFGVFQNISSSDKGSLHVLFLFFAGVMFACSVLFLFCFHLYLTSSNKSTLGNFYINISWDTSFIFTWNCERNESPMFTGWSWSEN